MDLGLKGKLALVTGSTAGIGYAIAQGLLAEGARVVINGRTPARVAAAVEHLKPAGDVFGVAADMATAAGAATVVDAVYGLGATTPFAVLPGFDQRYPPVAGVEGGRN